MEQHPDTMQIDVDTSDALEMGPVDAGEFKLQILKAEYRSGTAASGNEWSGILLTLDIPDVMEANIFSHMQFIPNEETQDGKQFERAKADFDKFKRALGFGPSDAFTIDQLQGREPWGYLTIQSDDEYGDRNKVSRWIAGPSAAAGADY